MIKRTDLYASLRPYAEEMQVTLGEVLFYEGDRGDIETETEVVLYTLSHIDLARVLEKAPQLIRVFEKTDQNEQEEQHDTLPQNGRIKTIEIEPENSISDQSPRKLRKYITFPTSSNTMRPIAVRPVSVDERTRPVSGYLGRQSRRDLPHDVAPLLFAAEVGTVIGPIKVETGCALYYIQQHCPAVLDEATKARCVRELYQLRLRREAKRSDISYPFLDSICTVAPLPREDVISSEEL